MKLIQRPAVIFTFGVLTFCIISFITCLGYEGRTRFVPLIVAAICIAFAGVILFGEFYPKFGKWLIAGFLDSSGNVEQSRFTDTGRHDKKKLLFTSIFIIASFILIYMVGFLLGGPLSIFFTFKWEGRTSWLTAALGGCATFMGLLFLQKVFGVYLFEGILFGGVAT